MIFGYTLFFCQKGQDICNHPKSAVLYAQKIARVIREIICNNSIALWSFTEQQ